MLGCGQRRNPGSFSGHTPIDLSVYLSRYRLLPESTCRVIEQSVVYISVCLQPSEVKRFAASIPLHPDLDVILSPRLYNHSAILQTLSLNQIVTMLSRALLIRTLRQTTRPSTRNLRTLSRPRIQRPLQTRYASHTPPLVRWLSSKSLADEKIEEITELYSTAKDEFEMAMEEVKSTESTHL